jgi:mRNA interferase HigB
MHIISKSPLQLFWQKYPTAERPLRAWLTQAKRAHWQNFAELRRDFPSADLAGRFIVFNIGGNKFRLITRVEFALRRVYIRQVLTHAEYDKERWKEDDWYT